jgi:hypothetical protein
MIVRHDFSLIDEGWPGSFGVCSGRRISAPACLQGPGFVIAFGWDSIVQPRAQGCFFASVNRKQLTLTLALTIS